MKPPLKLTLLGIVALLLIGGIIWMQYSPPAVNATAIGGPFQLVDSAGHPVTDQAFRGKYMLVYFGYTFCPDVCPTTLSDVATALDKLGPRAEQLQPLFITVDPQRDTPAVVGQYAANFSPRLVGLTGTPDQIATVAREYHVYYARHTTGSKPGDYSMDHSSILYLMGPDGHFIAPIRADEPPEAIANDIARHMT
jgi:protein SCO1